MEEGRERLISLWKKESLSRESSRADTRELEERLKNYDLDEIKEKKDGVVHATIRILCGMTHEDIMKFYAKSGVFQLHGYRKH